MMLLCKVLQLASGRCRLDIIDSDPEFQEDCHLLRAGSAQGLDALDLGSAR